MKNSQAYKSINIDLYEYTVNAKKRLYTSSLIYLFIVICLLIIQEVVDLNQTSMIVVDIFIFAVVCAEMLTSIGLKKKMIENRENRLRLLFEDKLDLDSEIYTNSLISSYDKNEIDEICEIEGRPHVRIGHTYQRIHAVQYDNEWIDKPVDANRLLKDHYAILYSRRLIDEIDESDFSEFVNHNDCVVLSLYEHDVHS